MIDARIIGVWQLRRTQALDDAGRALAPPYGAAANGVLCLQADGRMYCVLCDGSAELPPGETRQFMSYAGRYTFDGITLRTRVDASSDPDRIGGDQVRTVGFENGGMTLAPPRRLYRGVMQRQTLFWQRVDAGG